MQIKNIRHNIIMLKSKNNFILIIELKNISKFYIKIYFMATFTKKNKDHILTYFNMLAPKFNGDD